MVHPVNGSRLWGSDGQHVSQQRAVPTYANAPRTGVFQYQNPMYHHRAVQRQLWDQQSARDTSKYELGGFGRESETRFAKLASSEKFRSLRAPLPARRVYTQVSTFSTKQRDSNTSTKALETSIWSTTPLELAAMAQQLAQTKFAKKKPQSQSAKTKTWYYVDEHQQYPKESLSDDSTGDESSSDPEEDTPLSICRFHALAFMLPPSPWSR